jgi:hypothetical protein
MSIILIKIKFLVRVVRVVRVVRDVYFSNLDAHGLRLDFFKKFIHETNAQCPSGSRLAELSKLYRGRNKYLIYFKLIQSLLFKLNLFCNITAICLQTIHQAFVFLRKPAFTLFHTNKVYDFKTLRFFI